MMHFVAADGVKARPLPIIQTVAKGKGAIMKCGTDGHGKSIPLMRRMSLIYTEPCPAKTISIHSDNIVMSPHLNMAPNSNGSKPKNAVIVIGGGQNSPTKAGYLSLTGKKRLVLEPHNLVGGEAG